MYNYEFVKGFLRDRLSSAKLPLYVYENERIRFQCRKISEIPYDNKSIHFASMANSNSEFLKVIKEEGLNIFVNSKKHLELALSVGFDASQVVYTASSLPLETLDDLQAKEITVNLDSVNQLEYWVANYPETRVGIRFNINSEKAAKSRAGYFIGDKSRLGVDSEEIPVELKKHVNGLHIYVGTDIMDVEYFMHFYELLSEKALEFPNLEYLDLGGGFGVSDNEEFNFAAFGSRLTELMNGLSEKLGKNIRLILEPGRIVGADSAYFLARVLDTKKRGDKTIVILDASTAQFPRPLIYPNESHHPLRIFSPEGELKTGNTEKSMVVASSTYSRDIFTAEIDLPVVNPGDIAAFGNAGSYCSSMFTEFLGFEKAKEILI
ncbi:MAG: hypothetical protein C0592_07105 [Marinilabiliales bacterium]|nr:MAG: hypothetical protein C0592_07105 [Marinilabiliales bacterium]